MQPVVIDYDEEVDEESEQSEELAVPLIVSVIVLTAYIAIGGLIFPLWEEWSFADSAYFSFITLSTIGLGDLVLGAGRLHETRTTYELAIGAFYMLFGLALLSMCLNLLQYEMLAKFRHMLQYFTLCGRDKGTHGADQESDLREEEETALAVLRASRAVEKPTEPVSQKDPANGEGSSEIHKRATSSFENNAFESE
ncbi:unnamed protein product [Dicrocoelium dendriticum]|nr:unnamed protein product [Dicrocoelium dendriticum]